MAVKNREQVGWIDCPMCNTRGTVHKCEIGRGGRVGALYWRCWCGTIQPWKPKGQDFIKANMTPLEPIKPENPAQIDVEEQTGVPAEPEPETVEKPKKRSALSFLFEE